MTRLKRNYTQSTLKILFAMSGNECAHPECTNTIIEPGTEESDPVVIAHICHIYALSTDGPRGKAGLTEKELNDLENLILLCRNHHGLVDAQHETYTADMLQEWKKKHEKKMDFRKRLSNMEVARQNTLDLSAFPIELIDQKIEDEIDIICKSRFFMDFDRVGSSLALARRLVRGDLSGGNDAIRCQALAKCSRFLAYTKELSKAEEYLTIAKGLGSCVDIDIANAFISSHKGDKNAALGALGIIDSPISRSAALLIVAHHEGAEGVVDWLKATGITTVSLDSDGKYSLLIRYLELDSWDAAKEALNDITDQDLEATPALHSIIGMIYLLSTVPIELRLIVLNQLPFDAADFPLASDKAAIDARTEAHRRFATATKVAQQLNCPRTALVNDEYALWLELRDPEKSKEGRQRLEIKLSDPKSALRVVYLGLQFGIELDLAAVEQEIDRQIALHGGITQDAAIARFALAFTRKTPVDIANYITLYSDELSMHLNIKSIRFLQIEMFSRAGMPERANECLEILLTNGLSDAEESRLRRIIAEAEGTDPVEARKAQFKQTDSLQDLAALVNELETRKEWDGICEYGGILFERTHTVRNAERLVNALFNNQNTEKIIELLEMHSDLRTQSQSLQLLYCWSLYYEGELLEARSELEKLSDTWEIPNYSALKVTLGIALGDWNSLSVFLTKVASESDKKSSQDLISAAQLALNLESPYAKDLIFAAAAKGDNDANILATAYFLASNAGLEDDPEVVQWLHKAAKLSSDDGPLKQMTLKDLLDRKPEWDRREAETWQLLSRGEMPIFLAAQSLNKSLIDLMLFPALANPSESDPRRRGAISAYSGKRQPISFDAKGTVGIDATALLTLSYLNLLDKAFDVFDTVYIPHSTLSWLFNEKQKTSFHQPSRIRKAHQLHHLLVTDKLEKLAPSAVVHSELSAQVGDELAALIAEAEKVRDGDTAQCIVVRSSPVYRITPMMKEEADLTGHTAIMSSCLSIVNKLRQKGQITAQEENKACAYLQLHEKPWPHQPEISDGAILYLDGLSISYFQHLGMLEKLKSAGFKPIISPKQISEADTLITYESISGVINDSIEHIRSAINTRIESGKIKVGRRSNIHEQDEHSIDEHPNISVIKLTKNCDAIISDDRFLNQHARIEYGGYVKPLYSTLDLIDAMASSGSITSDNKLEYRTLLRRAGYFFLPTSEDELFSYLNDAIIKANKIIEPIELKAIRENILCVRMSKWLQLPNEASWLDTILQVFIRTLKKLWSANDQISNVKARSNWILDQIDIRGWAHAFVAEAGDNLFKTGRCIYILPLLTPPSNISEEVKSSYWTWIEDMVLAPIKEQYPDLYACIVELEKKKIRELADMDLTEEVTTR